MAKPTNSGPRLFTVIYQQIGPKEVRYLRVEEGHIKATGTNELAVLSQITPGEETASVENLAGLCSKPARVRVALSYGISGSLKSLEPAFSTTASAINHDLSSGIPIETALDLAGKFRIKHFVGLTRNGAIKAMIDSGLGPLKGHEGESAVDRGKIGASIVDQLSSKSFEPYAIWQINGTLGLPTIQRY